MTPPPNEDRDLNRVLDGFVERIAGVTSAAAATTDGLVIAHTAGIPRDRADQLAAVTSGLVSLTSGASRCFDAGPVNQVIVEMDAGYLFMTKVSAGSALAVMCRPDCDIGLVGYEMSLLATQIGGVLTPELRAGIQPPPPW